MSTLASASPARPFGPRAARALRTHAPELAFAAVLVLGAALVLVETRGLSFFADDWDFVVDRRGLSPDVLLRPHGPHLSLVPILVYKVLLQVFGGSSYLPFRMLAAFDIVILGLVLGVACRAWWGRWWGVAPVLLLVTLGPGGVSLLWSFQSGYAIAVAAGVVSLLALRSEGRRADLTSCLALIVSLASASQGIGFTAGAAVMLALRGDWRRRAWVVVIPAVLYGLWYLKWGAPYSETRISLWDTSLPYAAQALSATIGPLTGLSTVSPQTGLLDLTFGVPLAIAAIAALAVACGRGWRAPSIFWGVAATLVVLWVAASVSNWGPYPRAPNDPRYLSSDAVLFLICLCAALPRPRLRTQGAIVAAVALVIVAATNVRQYGVARNSMQGSDVISRAELGALLIMRGVVGPDFSPALPGDPSILVGVDARSFFSAYDSFGLMADSPETLLGLNETTREAVDRELARGELALSPASGGIGPGTHAPSVISGSGRASAGCIALTSAPVVIRAIPGRYELTASKSISVSMARFAGAYTVTLGPVLAGSPEVLPVPSDHALGIPWRMMVSGAGGRVCVA